MVSTNNKIRNENPASTGSLAGSKRVFLHSICLARARTNEPAANLLHQYRHVEIDAAGARPDFRQKIESMSKACRKPTRTCRKPGCKPGRKQLARIMECGLTTTLTYDWVCIRLCVCDSPSALLLNGYLRNSNGAPEQAFLWSQQLGEKIKFCELLRRKLSIQCC